MSNTEYGKFGSNQTELSEINELYREAMTSTDDGLALVLLLKWKFKVRKFLKGQAAIQRYLKSQTG